MLVCGDDPTLHEPFPLDESAWGSVCRDVADRQRREADYRSRQLREVIEQRDKLLSLVAQLQRELTELRQRGRMDRTEQIIACGGPIDSE